MCGLRLEEGKFLSIRALSLPDISFFVYWRCAQCLHFERSSLNTSGAGFFCGARSELPVLPSQNRARKSSLQALKCLFVTVTLEKCGILAPIHESASACAERPSLLRKALRTLLSFEEGLECLSEEEEEGFSGMGQKIGVTGHSRQGQEYINKPYINLK